MPERRFEFDALMREKELPAPDAQTMAELRDVVDEGVLGASNHVALALPLVARRRGGRAARRVGRGWSEAAARRGGELIARWVAALSGMRRLPIFDCSSTVADLVRVRG